MTPAEFIAKCSPTELPERAASQEYFIDLCRLLGQPVVPPRYGLASDGVGDVTFTSGVKTRILGRNPLARCALFGI